MHKCSKHTINMSISLRGGCSCVCADVNIKGQLAVAAAS